MLICITGIDGCGKGTQVELLSKFLEREGNSVVIVKAYGDMEKELFSAYMEYIDDLAIMFLFQAFHVQQRIRAENALKRNQIVIADRWDESYIAYHSNQGLLSKDTHLREKLNNIAFGGLTPDISFLLNVPPEEAMRRCEVRGADFFDKKGLKYHLRQKVAYEKIAKEGNNWIIINGLKSDLEIHREILSRIEKLG